MSHKNLPFVHERAKASLDSCVMDKWDVDFNTFVAAMDTHKQMPERHFHVIVQQYDDTLSGNASATAANNYQASHEGRAVDTAARGKESEQEAPCIAPLTSATKVVCSPDMLVEDFKRLYYDERIKARKRLAKEVFYRRVERESGPKKLEMVRYIDSLQREAR